MSSIVHFEIPVDDVERASKFYNMLFNWRPEKVAGPYEYWIVHTKKKEEEFGINGVMSRRKKQSDHIINYIDVDSIENYVRKVEHLGGKIVEQKTAVPKMGWFAICEDTENNYFGLWETDENAK